MVQPATGTDEAVKNLLLPTAFASKEKCLAYVQQLPALLMSKGFISASIDSMWQDSSSVQLILFPGKKYTWDSLRVENKDWPLLNQLGFYRASFNTKPFDQQKVTAVYNQLLDYFANNGYPFAKTFLDSIQLNDSAVNAKLQIDRGDLYHIDTIIIAGGIKISKTFLTHYLDIEEHSVYQQDKIDRISKRLTELPFLVQTQPYSVSMLNTGAELKLFLEGRKSNQINVLVGFQPSSQEIGGKLLLTGEANLNLRNPFGNGETLGINWQQLQSKSPRLDLVFQRPYLFHSPVGISVNFELYKRDSFFLNILSKVGASYTISARQAVSVFAQFNKTSVLDVDTNVVKITRRLPDVADISNTSLSVQYDFVNTNYRFNPRSGNELQLTAGFGNKTIKPSTAVSRNKRYHV